ncbi:subtilase family protein [Flavobacterium sp. 9]|uniref:S8 family peptidase n=1 Tax=Flavobacterium sp. 9 TaxID=2035198 RepID=UPI000C198DB5|nr:S8/S53 family peptidase [Flavobacterium sp. 9]PIF34312.1 subtilase family protein [Flavobacterium sp. 9]
MKLVVTANKLNVRKTPVIDFAKKSNIVGVIVKDSIHESTEQHENILGVWHKIDDGWVNEKWLSEDKTLENINWWFDKYKIPDWWTLTKGEDVLVSVFDSGIDTKNKYINTKIDFELSKNYWNNNNDITDLYFHGTHCSSLIVADTYNTFSGIAPEARISVIKITNKGSILNSVIAKALRDIIINPSIDIISISLQIETANDELILLFKEAVTKYNKIIVCSIGNNADKIPVEQDVYPAKLSLSIPIISVGSLNSLEEFSELNYLFPATIFCPGEDIYSFNASQVLVKESGTSQSTAIMSGIISLIISRLKQKNKQVLPELIKEMISSSTRKEKSEKYDITYNKLDMDLLFETLKSI